MSDKPKQYLKFGEKYRDVLNAYENMGDAVHGAGPLDEKSRALVKLGISAGARMEGALHSHVRKALDAGCSHDEIRHAILLSLPTIGLPNMMAAMTWVNDILE